MNYQNTFVGALKKNQNLTIAVIYLDITWRANFSISFYSIHHTTAHGIVQYTQCYPFRSLFGYQIKKVLLSYDDSQNEKVQTPFLRMIFIFNHAMLSLIPVRLANNAKVLILQERAQSISRNIIVVLIYIFARTFLPNMYNPSKT